VKGKKGSRLQNCSIVNLRLGHAEEFLSRRAQHEPVLLEDAEVGCVACFAVACDGVLFDYEHDTEGKRCLAVPYS
jgi:hypothetical protein